MISRNVSRRSSLIKAEDYPFGDAEARVFFCYNASEDINAFVILKTKKGIKFNILDINSVTITVIMERVTKNRRTRDHCF